MRPGLALALVTSSLVVACGHTVEVHDPFPDPVIESLPLRVGVHYTTEFSDYAYTEKEKGAGSWTLRLGGSSVRLFDKVFARLFAATTRVTEVKSDPPGSADLDAFIEPVVTNVEFSLPTQSHSNQYAVWVRYKLNVYDRDGQLLHEWPVAAYGQSEDRGLSGARSMTRAVELALRDAEATIATQFAQEPKIRDALLRPKETANAGTQ
jgi:hypothetical protein